MRLDLRSGPKDYRKILEGIMPIVNWPEYSIWHIGIRFGLKTIFQLILLLLPPKVRPLRLTTLLYAL